MIISMGLIGFLAFIFGVIIAGNILQWPVPDLTFTLALSIFVGLLFAVSQAAVEIKEKIDQVKNEIITTTKDIHKPSIVPQTMMTGPGYAGTYHTAFLADRYGGPVHNTYNATQYGENE